MKNLLGLLVGVLLVVALDFSLVLFGVAPLVNEDAMVGFAGSSSLFVPEGKAPDGSELYVRNPAKDRYFNPGSFRMPKPAGTFRIVTLGGSTTYGRPYLDDTSFSAWLENLLNNYGDNPNVEAINTGGISYASYRVLRVMREMVQYQPDLLVLYSGHNEFLEARTFAKQKDESPVLNTVRNLLHRSRLYTLVHKSVITVADDDRSVQVALPEDEVVATLEQVGGPELYHRDPLFRDQVIQAYRESLEAMVALVKTHRVPLILCTLPSNLSGISPFKSEHRPGLTTDAWRQWQNDYEKGLKALQENNPTLAFEAFSRAEEIDAEYAALHYYKGQALERLGLSDESYQAYLRAKQLDIIPLRALDEFNVILREVARKNGLPLADVEQFVRRVSPGGIPGNNLFVDHVHPSIEGQQLVAWVILDAAVRAGVVPLSRVDWEHDQPEAREFLRAGDRAISARYRAMGVWGVGRLFYWAGKFPEAYVTLKEAWQSVQDIPEIPRKLGLLELENGKPDAALEYFAAAEAMDPGHPWALIGMARAYNMTGLPERALEVLERLPGPREQDAAYLSARGRALVLLGRSAEGLNALRQAQMLAPDLPGREWDLAWGLARASKADEAAQHLRRYRELKRLPQDEQVVASWLKDFQEERGGRP